MVVGQEAGDLLPAPHVLVGDMDSCPAEHLALFRDVLGCRVQPSACQDTTDLEKALAFLEQHQQQQQQQVDGGGSESCDAIRLIVFYGAFGGRLDHELASLSALHKHQQQHQQQQGSQQHRRILLMDRDNCVELLQRGKHCIYPSCALEPSSDNDDDATATTCAVVPLAGAAASVTSTGLKYNLQHTRLAMGELISTSNALAASCVTIDTSDPLIWMTQPKRQQ
jgi:thiamine pyrophosphokinase